MKDTHIIDFFASMIPVLLIFAVLLAGLIVVDRILKKRAVRSDAGSLTHPLIMLGLSAVSLICIILVLPTSDHTRGQLLGLLGLSLTAIITLSSTTFVANAMAGLMIRAVGAFKPGDFIDVDGFFGRVTVRGLFHTEIQTEDRDIAALPNLVLTTHPVKVVLSNGTIISATVSLGYDLSHSRLEPLLLKAVEEAGLTEAFVHISELGDYSVTYRVAGFLEDVRELVSAKSRLREAILDELHGAGVEIASPSIMLQRPLTPETRLIPTEPVVVPSQGEAAGPENLIFDKADEAASVQALRDEYDLLVKELKGIDKDSTDHVTRQKARIKAVEAKLKRAEDAASDSSTKEG